jgi:putative two-component system response regulator
MLERTLQIAGIEVLAVPDGSEALVAAKDWNADVMLLDGIMPGLDGFEVCRRVKADPRTMLLPVMLITGLDSRADRVRGVEVGADGFMSKPFGRLDLLARVRSLARMKFATDRLDRAEALLVAMARRIEAKDPDMHGHCERLSACATRLARRLGLDAEAVDALRLGGIIHDIGKVAIPEAILLKPTPLDDTEWGIMRDHPVEGERICEGLKSFKQVLPIIRHHHERLDGSGYPDGLAGDDIPMSARLLQLVDIYDVLTTERPYKAAQSPNAAFATIESEVNRGWRDRDLFKEFRQLVRDEPNMSVGAMGVVN